MAYLIASGVDGRGTSPDLVMEYSRCQLVACRALVPRVVQCLVGCCESEDDEVHEEACSALRQVLGCCVMMDGAPSSAPKKKEAYIEDVVTVIRKLLQYRLVIHRVVLVILGCLFPVPDPEVLSCATCVAVQVSKIVDSDYPIPGSSIRSFQGT